MKKTIPEYTTVDLSRWARKEHFEVFQSFAQSTINQTVNLDITVLLKHIKEVGWRFYPTMISLLSKIANSHSEFRMAMKNNELVIWKEVHPSYTKRRRSHHYGARTMAIFKTSRRFIPKTLHAMVIIFLIGLRANLRKIYFSSRLFHGEVLPVLILTWLTCRTFLPLCSRLENISTRMGKYCCLSPFRSITPCAMVSMWQDSSMNCRRCVMTYRTFQRGAMPDAPVVLISPFTGSGQHR